VVLASGGQDPLRFIEGGLLDDRWVAAGAGDAAEGQFGEVFARSAAAAGLAETAGEGKITLVTKPQARASDDESPGLADLPADGGPAAPGRAGGSALKPVLDQHWPIPDGEVALTVTIARPLSATDFASIGSVVAEIEKLVASLSGGGGANA
jgi:hypothetical protein